MTQSNSFAERVRWARKIREINAAERFRSLIEAARRLRVYESMRPDLSYDAADPRSRTPDNEMPQEWLDTLTELQSTLTYAAAIYCNETIANAVAYADAPTGDHSYSIERVRMALAIGGYWP